MPGNNWELRVLIGRRAASRGASSWQSSEPIETTSCSGQIASPQVSKALAADSSWIVGQVGDMNSTSSQQNYQHQQQRYRSLASSYSSLPGYNSAPRPFVGGSGGGFRSASVVPERPVQHVLEPAPRLLLNGSPQPVYRAEPTSTVHKSLRQQQTGSRVQYERLMSSQASLLQQQRERQRQQHQAASLPTSAHLQQQQQQQQQHLRQQQHQLERQKMEEQHRLASEQQQVAWSSPTSGLAGSPVSPTSNLHHNHQQRPQQQHYQLDSKASRARSQLHNSNVVLPDTMKDEYMRTRRIERVQLAHQTYRTLPLVMPKPKARHDLAMGAYMQLNQDPTWDLVRNEAAQKQGLRKHYDSKIEQALEFADGQLGRASQPRSGTSVEDEQESPAFNYREYIRTTMRRPN